jgi:hypothetical protein
MNNTEYIQLFQELAHKALINAYHAFRGNPKLILTESDLKCRVYMELQRLIDIQTKANLSVHSEVTHYSGNFVFDRNNLLRKEYFMRDLTILDSDYLDLNSDGWNEINDEYALSKGFRHDGPALHFELKLIRQPIEENARVLIDAADITKLNNVNAKNRAYTIVIGSKNDNLDRIIASVKRKLLSFTNDTLVINNLLRIYLFDINELRIFKSQDGTLQELIDENNQ